MKGPGPGEGAVPQGSASQRPFARMHNFFVLEHGDKWARDGTKFRPLDSSGHPTAVPRVPWNSSGPKEAAKGSSRKRPRTAQQAKRATSSPPLFPHLATTAHGATTSPTTTRVAPAWDASDKFTSTGYVAFLLLHPRKSRFPGWSCQGVSAPPPPH